MYINHRDNLESMALPSASAVAPADIGNTALTPTTLRNVKIYAFGSMALLIAFILGSLGYWIWKAVVKRESVDSPGQLESHPEPMRGEESVQQEQMMLERERKEGDRFTPLPVRYEQKFGGRNRSCSLPVKPDMHHADIPTTNARGRKSSFSTSSSKGKRVSWASSTSTLDVGGNASAEPLNTKVSPRTSFKSSLHPIPSYHNPLSVVPRAHTSIPRSSTSVEPRSRRGLEMISATTPDMASSWAKAENPLASKCTCGSVDPLYVSNTNHLRPYRD